MRPSSLLLCIPLVVACGKVQVTVDSNTTIDAFTGPDADPHGIAKITVLDVLGNGAPEANVPVIFFNPDGTMVGDTTSDTAGKAQATILPGASVTAVWLRGTRYTVATIFDIKPGDDLTMGFTHRDSTADGTFPVTFPARAGATSYSVYGPCGEVSGTPGTTVQLPFQKNCKPATFDIYVISNTASGPSEVAQKLGVKLTDASATIPNSWFSLASFSSQYTNVPSDITKISLDHNSGSINGFDASATGVPASGSLALNASPVPLAGDKAFVSTGFSRADNSQQVYRQRIAGNSSAYGVDVGSNLLPWITAPTFDVTTQTFTQTVTGTSPYDVFVVDYQYNRTTPAFMYEWITFGPQAQDTKLPTLPAHVGMVNPVTTDTLKKPFVILLDSGDLTGWDMTRPAVFDAVDQVFQGAGPANTVRASLDQGT